MITLILKEKYSGIDGYSKLIEESYDWKEEVVINGHRVFIEDVEVHTILSDKIKRRSLMSVEVSKLLTMISVLKIYQFHNG